jgi:hypothetical protein
VGAWRRVADVHLALRGAFGFLLLGFDLAGHLVLLSAGGLVWARMRGRARGRIAYNRASRWPGGGGLLVRPRTSTEVGDNVPMTRFTCANLRVFFWTPMLAVLCSRPRWQSSIDSELELFGGAVAPRVRSGKNEQQRPMRASGWRRWPEIACGRGALARPTYAGSMATWRWCLQRDGGFGDFRRSLNRRHGTTRACLVTNRQIARIDCYS